MFPTFTLAAALLLYALACGIVLFSLIRREGRFQNAAFALMCAGFVAHTMWIGVVCVRTNHPPLTNLPEAAAFISWTILAIEIFLFVRYRIHAVAFFIYPLVLLLLAITAIVRERYVELAASAQSNLFVAHSFLATVGIAALMIGLVFTLLYQVQERALREKRRGALYEWIPSLQLCDTLSYRSLAIGFTVYTLGLLAGLMWALRKSSAAASVGAKEIAAVIAWVFFAALLQSYLAGSFRTRRNLVISAAAFLSIIVAVLGIHHG